ncbi:hypothetical protein ACFFMM_22465 [Micromonospora chaiyaphumensis]|uniref:Uncharacterized protein n=1 Tax=Micromonospora chaiyaphumensis TaxID=307119 RepID=A0A1C4U6Q6_9ACTN|nr:hypothetical protein [Micromonospora chaiyaphumensis]SCE67287.1 hypothetical protein GA0070214_101394 [Micromonospora chaiyaphumensis]
MPAFGDLFTDLRGEDRTLRVSYHPDRGAVVLSLWSGTLCRGSFRMPADDVDRLLGLLSAVRAAADGDDTAGPGTAAVEVPAAVTEPAVERTGDISGTARRVALPAVPAPRVA